MSQNVNDTHDRFFRETFSRRDVAEGFLRSYLPPAVAERIDWHSLEIAKDSFIEKALRHHFSDLLYSVRYGGRDIKIYLLIEHKSHPDQWVALQLLRYQVRIWELHRKQRAGEPLPPIVPLVLYHGQAAWRVPGNFQTLFGGLDEALVPYVPEFQYELCNLTLPDPEAIRGTVLSRLVLLGLKHIFDPDPKQALADILPLVRDILDRNTALEMLEVLLRYYVQTTKVLEEDDIYDLIEATGEDDMTTFIDRYIEQGRQQGLFAGMEKGMEKGREEGLLKGRQEGQAEVLLRLMARKFGSLTTGQRRRIRRADGETLLRWSEQVLFAETPDEALR
ncbi:Rpn family recombination-promoting nuclease/putative transposase [Methylomagnum sp.]